MYTEGTEERMILGVPRYWDVGLGEHYWKVLLVSRELGFGVWTVDITSSHPINWSGLLHWGGGKVQGDSGERERG